MWNCSKCNEEIEDTFDTCWKCGVIESDNGESTCQDQNEIAQSRYHPGTLINEVIVKDAKGLLKGNISLGTAFWLFGIFFGAILWMVLGGFAALIFFSIEKLGFNFESSVLVIPNSFRFILWVLLSIGIWKCGKNSSIIWRWASRIVYIGIGGYFFFLSFVFTVALMMD
jgi:hypothetical protein